jgi:hypothetical protein
MRGPSARPQINLPARKTGPDGSRTFPESVQIEAIRQSVVNE